MDPNQVVTATATLLAAVIGASAVLLAQRAHWHRARVAEAQDQVAGAIQEVLVISLSIDLRAHEFSILARDTSSMAGQVGRLFGTVTAVDIQRVFELLNTDAAALTRASTQIWMASDQETVELTNDLVLAAMEVVEAHHARRPGNRIIRLLHELFFGKQLGDPTRVEATRVKLAEARRQLVHHSREQLGLPAVDLVHQ